MGRGRRRRQRKLAEKLLRIREGLGLSQSEMVRHLGLAEEFERTAVSNFECAEREPPLFVLLRYARAAGICLDVLVDDELNLPNHLPAAPIHHPTDRQHSMTGSENSMDDSELDSPATE